MSQNQTPSLPLLMMEAVACYLLLAYLHSSLL